MHLYGHSVRDLARLAGVTERSARRWKVAGLIPEPYSTRQRELEDRAAPLLDDSPLGLREREKRLDLEIAQITRR